MLRLFKKMEFKYNRDVIPILHLKKFMKKLFLKRQTLFFPLSNSHSVLPTEDLFLCTLIYLYALKPY